MNAKAVSHANHGVRQEPRRSQRGAPRTLFDTFGDGTPGLPGRDRAIAEDLGDDEARACACTD